MFNLNDTMRYFLCPGRTDMRKGISSLCGVVHEKMKSEVKNGDVFIFIGSNRRLMKLLHAEDGGMVMYVKRLEAGRFKLPEYDPESDSYPMEWRDLVMMVEGIQESPGQRLRRLRAERKEYTMYDMFFIEKSAGMNHWQANTASKDTFNATVLQAMRQPSRPTPTCGWSIAWRISAVILSMPWVKTKRKPNMGWPRYSTCTGLSTAATRRACRPTDAKRNAGN